MYNQTCLEGLSCIKKSCRKGGLYIEVWQNINLRKY